MCILFIHTSTNPLNRYKLILASNRDECYERPAAVAHHWDENPNIFGGRDLLPGCEGGTWLAAHPIKQKIGALLNLTGVTHSQISLGRGSIVKDFVLGNKNTIEYLKHFENHEKEYSPFIFITVENSDNSTCVHFYSNFNNKHITFNEGTFVFSNSILEEPLKKTIEGKKKFKEIIKNFTNTNESKEQLINNLLSLLKCEELYLPDEVLQKKQPNYDELAAIFVKIPQNKYGTRTHTIILQDFENNMEFIEWTKIPNQSEWLKTCLYFKNQTQ